MDAHRAAGLELPELLARLELLELLELPEVAGGAFGKRMLGALAELRQTDSAAGLAVVDSATRSPRPADGKELEHSPELELEAHGHWPTVERRGI